MKRIYTLMLLLTISNTIVADSEFFLKINQQGRYKVYFDDEVLNSKKNIFRFFDVCSGIHSLKVVRFNGWQQAVVYQDNITIQNGYRYAAELSPNMGLNLIAQIPYIEKNWYTDQLQNPTLNCSFGCSSPCQHQQQPPQPHNGNCQYGCQGNCQHQTWNYGATNFGVMDDASFQSLKQTMKSQSFDNSMIQIAKTALKNTRVTSQQVAELLGLLTFESNRLELAKYCYEKTADKQNYFKIYNNFTFSSSINELNKYIESK